MRRLLALPLLAVALSAQRAPELVVSVGHAATPSHAAFVGTYLATASASNVALIELSSGITIAHLAHRSLVLSLEANPNSDLLAVGTCDRSIDLWDVKSRTSAPHRADSGVRGISFVQPGWSFLATGVYGCCSGGGLQIWNVVKGTLARQIAKGIGIRGVVFSRDGRWLIGIDDKNKAHVFEWPSGRELRTYDGLADGAGASESVARSSPDGKSFAWIGLRNLQVWDMSNGVQVPLPGARSVTISDRPPGGPERTRTEQQVIASAAEFLNDGRLAYVDGDRVVILTLPNGPMQEVPLGTPNTERSGHVDVVTFLVEDSS